ncbi:hypothetical protein HU200_024063 [Digitaria exilis]|uniref:Uncharacterized protein n=1 Tax=Digitaria exilis TaxID=1010633 RepID=A0A835ET77_9POAL|nr:hypothetical protein HU200_024063 [Digitaria exilis]CAB3461058.1 unnamed protein product [Digitaria exilis]
MIRAPRLLADNWPSPIRRRRRLPASAIRSSCRLARPPAARRAKPSPGTAPRVVPPRPCSRPADGSGRARPRPRSGDRR